MGLSVKDFAAKVKQKYPQYANVDDVTLAHKIVEKHPEYKAQVDFGGSVSTQQQVPDEIKRQAEKTAFETTPMGAVGSVATGALKGIGSTVNSGIKLASDVLSPALSYATGGRLNVKMGLDQATEDKYLKPEGLLEQGGYMGEKIGEFLAPSGLVSKMAKGAQAGASAIGLAPKFAKAAGSIAGFTGDVLSATGVNAIQEKRMPTLDDIRNNALWNGGTLVAGKLLKGVGKGFMNQLIGASKGEKAVLEKRGKDIYGALANDIGVVATKKGMAKKATEAIKKYSPQLDNVINNLDDSGKTINTNDLLKGLNSKNLAKDLKNILKESTLSGRNKVLQQIDEEIGMAKKTIGDGYLSIKKTNLLKRKFDAPVNWNKLDATEKAAVLVDKTIANNARAALDKISNGRITELNAKISPLLELGKLAQKGEYSKTLGDIVAASGGFGGGGIKGAITGLALQRALRHPITQSIAGSGLYKLGNKLVNPIVRRLVLGVENSAINQ